MILLTEGQSMSRLFDLDMQLLADATLVLIAIFILFILLSYLFFNPARKMLQERKNKIKQELADAKDYMEQATSLKDEYENKIKEIQKEAEEILGEARKKALQNENNIIAKAKADASRIMERAHVEAELEKKKMADEVKKEIVAVASVMAGKVLTASIDTTIEESLLNETLKEIGENTWLS